MKQFLIFVLVAWSGSVAAQSGAVISKVRFCGTEYAVPAGCTAQSEYEVRCSSYAIQWIPTLEKASVSLSEKLIANTEQQQDPSKRSLYEKKQVKVLLANQPATACYRINYMGRDGKMTHKLIAYGIVSGQSVCVILSSENELDTNSDIPSFAGKIIQFVT
ncbi:MAG: hypothetical protein H0W62_11515 [Chitinophagales bacterium]|nr:hypothetical protein [Chitinophagales bacterium]